MVRRRAASALGQLGSEAAILGLLKALKDQNPEVRRSAVYALGKLGSEAAIPGLLRALREKEPTCGNGQPLPRKTEQRSRYSGFTEGSARFGT